MSIRGNLKYKTWRILYSLVYVVRKGTSWHVAFKVNVNRLLVYASQEAYSVRKSVKFHTTYVNLIKFICTVPEKIVFLYWKGTADEYDVKFTPGCNSIVCLNVFESKAESKVERGAYFTVVYIQPQATMQLI